MLFPEDDAPLLKAWIVKRIEDTSDADSDVLADYVIALLKHDGDRESVRRLCEQEIPDFLTEDPKQFLDDVFQAITYKSYIPGAPPPPPLPQAAAPKPQPQPARPARPARPPQPPQPPPTRPPTQTPRGSILPPAPATQTAASPESLRKRRYHDQSGPASDVAADGTRGAGAPAAGRAVKQARRGRRGRADDGHNPYGFQYPMSMMMAPFDTDNPMEFMMRMQAMGLSFPPLPPLHDWAFSERADGMGGLPKKKGRCRDFDTKGYCSRGSTCVFDHGHGGDDAMLSKDEYDPAKAMMNVLQTPDAAAPGWPARGKQRGGRKGGARAPFSAEGPVTDHSKTTIVVENIPEEHFSEDQVRGFFSQFGNICQVSMQPYKHLAIVKFETWASANNAYRSPSVIFDNRFVKVFWYKDDKEKLPPSGPVPVTPANGTKLAPGSGNEAADAEPGIDMEEFQRRQEEAQKAYKEREDKRSALEKQRQELERKQQELLSKHQAEAERLQAKLAGKLGGGKEASPSASGADMLRAKLAALEQEAKMLGLDPNAAADDSSRHAGQAAAYHRGRGGHRGRASAYRGRGSFSAQAGRHAAYSQFSLDNRPKKLAVTGVDFTASDKDERLRHFLLNLGEFESVHTTPTVTHVSFRDRKTAEKFYSSLHGNELPGVEGRLELSWLSGVGAGASASVSVSVSGTGDATAGIDDDGPEEPREEQVREEERPVNMDYEVGDDYGWEG